MGGGGWIRCAMFHVPKKTNVKHSGVAISIISIIFGKPRCKDKPVLFYSIWFTETSLRVKKGRMRAVAHMTFFFLGLRHNYNSSTFVNCMFIWFLVVNLNLTGKLLILPVYLPT